MTEGWLDKGPGETIHYFRQVPDPSDGFKALCHRGGWAPQSTAAKLTTDAPRLPCVFCAAKLHREAAPKFCSVCPNNKACLDMGGCLKDIRKAIRPEAD